MANVNFDTWLTEKIKSLSLDEDVYVDYIKGVVEEAQSLEETKETLCDILSGVLVRITHYLAIRENTFIKIPFYTFFYITHSMPNQLGPTPTISELAHFFHTSSVSYK